MNPPASSGLSRNETDPGCEVASGFEHIGVGDGCGNCRGRDHPDSGNGLQPLAHLARTMTSEDRLSDRADAHLQILDLAHDQFNAGSHRIGQY